MKTKLLRKLRLEAFNRIDYCTGRHWDMNIIKLNNLDKLKEDYEILYTGSMMDVFNKLEHYRFLYVLERIKELRVIRDNSLCYRLKNRSKKSEKKNYFVGDKFDFVRALIDSSGDERKRLVRAVNWKQISEKERLSEDFIRTFKEYVDWNLISVYQKLSEPFIIEFYNHINWSGICSSQDLSEKFLMYYSSNLDWYLVSCKQKLSENFIRVFKDKVDWGWISIKQNISEDFIREFKDYVDWQSLSIYKYLSEEFILEFEDRVDWYHIGKRAYLSTEFRFTFRDRFNKEYNYEKEKKHGIDSKQTRLFASVTERRDVR